MRRVTVIRTKLFCLKFFCYYFVLSYRWQNNFLFFRGRGLLGGGSVHSCMSFTEHFTSHWYIGIITITILYWKTSALSRSYSFRVKTDSLQLKYWFSRTKNYRFLHCCSRLNVSFYMFESQNCTFWIFHQESKACIWSQEIALKSCKCFIVNFQFML